MPKLITLDEVKKHNSDKSVWLVIHNDVYDVTKFLDEHPGGPESLLDVAGQDGTQAFEDVGHSDDARELMKKYKIGTLPASERSKPIENCATSRTVGTSCESLRDLRAKSDSKTWRTYDGSSGSRKSPSKTEFKPPCSPKVERRVQTIVVPRERHRRRPPEGRPPSSSSKLKWALLALAGAIVIGVVAKKYMG